MTEEHAQDQKKPVPLSANARRVLGVLIEKAKTTPDNYPMTLSALVSGSNQKSNRSPQMQLDEDDVLTALDELRNLGAAREIQGSGRATKYRHAAYEWFNVDSPGVAVITELFLRGPQTIGELRSRASRMHAFDDLASTQAVLSDLSDKGLVEALTPPGRGQTFAHTLYPPDERQFLEAKLEKQASASSGSKPSGDAVDKIIDRLDAMTEKLQSLEQRLEQLESKG